MSWADSIATSTRWYELPWQDWAGLTFALIGFPLGALGLWLTWRQARAARTAADAAAAATRMTQRKIRASQMLVLIPQLRWIAQALEEAIDSNEPTITRKHLDNWRWSAANVRGYLTTDDETERGLMEGIQSSVSLAFAANTALAEGRSSVMNACKRARSSIHEVCVELTSWAGNQAMTIENAEASNDD